MQSKSKTTKRQAKEREQHWHKKLAKQRRKSKGTAHGPRPTRNQHEAALQILRENREQLDRVARKLIEVETLDMADFEAVYLGQQPPSESGPTGAPSAPRPQRPAPETPAPSGAGPLPVPSGA